MSTYKELKAIGDLLSGSGAVVTDPVAQASLASIDAKTPALGQALMAASQPVVIASDQTEVPVTSATLAQESGGNLAELALSNGFPENMPLRLGLLNGIVRRFCTGDGVVFQNTTTFGAGMDNGETLSFDRSAPLVSVASTSALDTWYVPIVSVNDTLAWTTGGVPFSVDMTSVLGPFTNIPVLFYVSFVLGAMSALDPTIVDVQYDLINSTQTGGRVLIVSTGAGGPLQLTAGDGWATLGFTGTETTPGGALFATNVPPGGGTGARGVLVNYIDAAGDQITTLVPLNGTTPVPIHLNGIPQGVQCINFLGITHAGNTELNQGRIYAGLSPPADAWLLGKPVLGLWMVIEALRGVSAVVWFMVPKGFTSHVLKLIISTDSATKTDNVMFNTRTHQTLFGFSVVQRSAITIAIIHNVHIDSHSLPGFEENWVFTIEAVSSTNGVNATVNIHMIDVNDAIHPTPPPFA